MFKASIQRQALVGSVARRQFSSRTVSTLLSSNLIRSTQAIPGQSLSRAVLRPVSLVRHAIPRYYSAEAAAVRSGEDGPSRASPDEPVTLFKDLTALGVNQNLVDALVRGMGYETMTPVQAATINPAMKGVDL